MSAQTTALVLEAREIWGHALHADKPENGAAHQSISRMMDDNSRKLRAQRQGRLQAARINGGASAVTPRGHGVFTVKGRTGTRYTVRHISRDEIRCDCQAGLFGNYCWHAACVYLWALMFGTTHPMKEAA